MEIVNDCRLGIYPRKNSWENSQMGTIAGKCCRHLLKNSIRTLVVRGVFSSNLVRCLVHFHIRIVVDAITVTRGWNYLLCRKQESQYTFIGPGVVDALPQESSDVLLDSAQRHIKKISNLDTATASLNISMWGVRKVYLFARARTDF